MEHHFKKGAIRDWIPSNSEADKKFISPFLLFKGKEVSKAIPESFMVKKQITMEGNDI